MPRTRWSGELSQVYSPEVDAASDLSHRWFMGASSARPPPVPRARPARGRSRGVRLHRCLTAFAASTRVASGRANGRSQLRQIGSPATSAARFSTQGTRAADSMGAAVHSGTQQRSRQLRVRVYSAAAQSAAPSRDESTSTALRVTHHKGEGGGCSARRLLPRAATQASFADASLTRYGKAHGY
ncbi:hypothetical protein T492DRAFT_1016533 [Pavlovales sp. CCMP2436]|nr:hypothetical protein T492DRAFT_1016533 [Pavlovales sp. CCMP2436]